MTIAAKLTGKLVSFEGIDGAGKSTHIAFVQQQLEKRGKKVIITREPGGTPLGETLRSLLLQEKMHVETEALLMFAARREHIAQLIQPALEQGVWVITDRFSDASFAYQGGGRKLAIDKLNVLEQWVHPDLQPDLTLLFDVPIAVARARLDATRTLDKFEQENADFFQDTRNEYLRRADEFSQRFRILDSTLSIAEIQAQLVVLIDQLCQTSE
ncbi:MAG: dTMP kinase [Undibacterium sp.]|nr:dTMP kinase [Undibacterium sp.]